MDAFLSVLLPKLECLLKSMFKNVNKFLYFLRQMFILKKWLVSWSIYKKKCIIKKITNYLNKVYFSKVHKQFCLILKVTQTSSLYIFYDAIQLNNGIHYGPNLIKKKKKLWFTLISLGMKWLTRRSIHYFTIHV